MKLKQAKLICALIWAGELMDGLIIYLLHKFSLLQVKPNPSLLKPIYYSGAGIVIFMLVLKKVLLKPSRFIVMEEERILPSIALSFVVLTAVAASLSVLALLLYLTTGLLKYSLTMVLLALIASVMVFPYNMAVEGLVYEIKRRKEMGEIPPTS